MVERIAGGIAALILIATAGLHLTGFSSAVAFADAARDAGWLSRTVPALWLIPAGHWIAFAVLIGGLAAFRPDGRQWMLAVIALVLCADAAAVFWSLGPFIGAWTALAAGVLTGVAAITARPR